MDLGSGLEEHGQLRLAWNVMYHNCSAVLLSRLSSWSLCHHGSSVDKQSEPVRHVPDVLLSRSLQLISNGPVVNGSFTFRPEQHLLKTLFVSSDDGQENGCDVPVLDGGFSVLRCFDDCDGCLGWVLCF